MNKNYHSNYFARDIGSDWIVFSHEIEGLSDEEFVEKDPVLAELVRNARK